MTAGHHLIENQHGAHFARGVAQPRQEFARARNAATAAHHGFQQYSSQISRVFADQRQCAGQVIIFSKRHRKRRIHHTATGDEAHHATMIAATEGDDLAAPGMRARGCQGHQIRLGPAIGEAHHF